MGNGGEEESLGAKDPKDAIRGRKEGSARRRRKCLHVRTRPRLHTVRTFMRPKVRSG